MYTAVQTSMPRFRNWMENRLRSPDQGVDTVVWLCVANQARDQPSGSFFQGIIVAITQWHALYYHLSKNFQIVMWPQSTFPGPSLVPLKQTRLSWWQNWRSLPRGSQERPHPLLWQQPTPHNRKRQSPRLQLLQKRPQRNETYRLLLLVFIHMHDIKLTTKLLVHVLQYLQ